MIGLLDLRPGITPEDFEKALEELDVDKVLDANRTARVERSFPPSFGGKLLAGEGERRTERDMGRR